MKQYGYGFMLIEVMVGSCVLILLTVLSMSYAARVYQQTCHMLQVSRRYTQMQVALDALVHDVCQAPISKTLWQCATTTRHVWTTPHDDVGFENTTQGMVRSQGLFDRNRKEWTHRTKSFFPLGLSYSIELLSQDHACVYLVCLKILSTDRSCVATTVALRSGGCV